MATPPGHPPPPSAASTRPASALGTMATPSAVAEPASLPRPRPRSATPAPSHRLTVLTADTSRRVPTSTVDPDLTVVPLDLVPPHAPLSPTRSIRKPSGAASSIAGPASIAIAADPAAPQAPVRTSWFRPPSSIFRNSVVVADKARANAVPNSIAPATAASTAQRGHHTVVTDDPAHRPRMHSRGSQWRSRCILLFAAYLRVAVFLGLFITLILVVYYKYNGEPVAYSDLHFPWQIHPLDRGLVPLDSAFPLNNTGTLAIADLHSHSTKSDGRLTPRQLLEYALAQGYNAIAVTDHNSITGGLEAERLALTDAQFKDRLLVIPGVEYTCCRIHLSLLGINTTITPPRASPTDDELRAVINQTHSLGGLVIVNHVPWSTQLADGYPNTPRLPNHPTRMQLIEWGVDGFEIINQNTYDVPSVQLAAQTKLLQVAGSDTHFPGPSYAWNLIDVSGFDANGTTLPTSTPEPARTDGKLSPRITKPAVLAALRARRNTILFDAAGTLDRAPDLPENPTYQFLAPLLALGEALQSFYSHKRGQYAFVHGEWCQPESVSTNSAQIAAAAFWVAILVPSWIGLRAAAESARQRWVDWRFAVHGWQDQSRPLVV
ncbi:hypothetical protein GGF32_000573 [Allomyces javanicus]|nr:hypothetical protein GGF32_000573 [Allomyces javanicus]